MVPKSSPKQHKEETWELERKASVPEWNLSEFTLLYCGVFLYLYLGFEQTHFCLVLKHKDHEEQGMVQYQPGHTRTCKVALVHTSGSSYHPHLPPPHLRVQVIILILLLHPSGSIHHPYLPSWNCPEFPCPGHPGGQEKVQVPWAPAMNTSLSVGSQFHGTSAVTRVSPPPQSSPRSCLPRWGSLPLPVSVKQFTKVWIDSRAQKTRIEMHPSCCWCQEYDSEQLPLFIDFKKMKTSGLAWKGAAKSILESK